MAEVHIREALVGDCKDIFRMVKELAQFHKMEVIWSNEETIKQDGFGAHPTFKCIVAELPPESKSADGHTLVALALYSYMYSTWKGPIVFLDSLYVDSEFRGKGIGKALLRKVCKMTLQEGCTFMRWFAVAWNKAATNFYLKEGAQDLTIKDDEHSFGFSQAAMEAMAEHSEKRLVTNVS
uniref:thialysine N-epsilon-acetyltransferase-like n=1 Tax=Myxine glutinosa TaxID=7769 RepID=UPI00358E3F97